MRYRNFSWLLRGLWSDYIPVTLLSPPPPTLMTTDSLKLFCKTSYTVCSVDVRLLSTISDGFYQTASHFPFSFHCCEIGHSLYSTTKSSHLSTPKLWFWQLFWFFSINALHNDIISGKNFRWLIPSYACRSLLAEAKIYRAIFQKLESTNCIARVCVK